MEAEALLLDLDGTLYEDDAPLPGAVETLARLRAAGLVLRFVTNTTRRPRHAVADRLREMGFDIADAELVTPAVAAARWIEREGLASVRLYLPEEASVDFGERSFEVVGVGDAAEPAAIVVGDLGHAWTFEILNAAFADLQAGARLVALHRNRYWRSGGRLVLDAGPFVAALEYAAGADACVVGKPSGEFFALARTGIDRAPARVAMVGDDVETDVAGGQSAGLKGVLVRTGKYTDVGLRASGVRPDAVIDDVRELPRLLGL